ncbi:hypothetical protein [Streptomyces sp. NPDC059783]|uniref:hypothetical protein n=1 Tax=Streptomyces sp. NPDC059783 TaxID=3346944 RepID=UPI00364C89AB
MAAETALSADARSILRTVARHLTTVRPDDPLDDGHRRALLVTHVADRCGYRTTLADTVHAEVLAATPRIGPDGTTRGQYAQLLTAAAK